MLFLSLVSSGNHGIIAHHYPSIQEFFPKAPKKPGKEDGIFEIPQLPSKQSEISDVLNESAGFHETL